MASAHNLLGLVNQLQNLEISFSKILMETAMKLSALTDLNVFVLVETQDGRRFSGKRHLCDAYIDGSLACRGDDVEFEINPSVFALQQRNRCMPARPSPQRRNNLQRCSPGTNIAHRRSPKRVCAAFETSPLVKRLRPNPSEVGELTLDADQSGGEEEEGHPDDNRLGHALLNSSGDTSTSSRVDDDDGAAVESRLKFDPESFMEADVVEAELADAQLDEQTGEMRASASALVPFNGDHEFDRERNHSDRSLEASAERTRNDKASSSPFAAESVVGALSPRGGGLRGILEQSSKSIIDFDLENCEELNRQLMESLPHTLVSKLEGLSQFQSGPNLIPGSTEFRLLNSILYEFGIHTRSFCPFDTALPAAKKFLYNNLDSLITLFPILDAIVHHGGKFPIGSRQITKLTYFREKTKKAFMKYVKTGPAILAKEQANAVVGKDVSKDLSDAAQSHPPQQQTQFAHHRLEFQEF